MPKVQQQIQNVQQMEYQGNVLQRLRTQRQPRIPHSEYSQQQKDDFLKWMTDCRQTNQG
jgi:hypothetical protein